MGETTAAQTAEKGKTDAASAQANAVVASAPVGPDAKQLEEKSERDLGIRWRGTLGWAVFIVLWYSLLQSSLAKVVHPDEDARQLLFQQVPLHVYIFSEAAFFCATVLNLISLVFEDTPEKKQLALLSAIIKGLSCHCDYLIITGRAVVTFDAHGALFLPSRYVQWSCSTPTMIFTLSRISDLQPAEIAATLLADWLMVVTGYMAAELPWSLAWLPLLVCFVCFAYVLYMLNRMINSALAEASTFHARACLYFTLGSTMIIWNLFWVAWVIARLPGSLATWGEPLTIFCNFSAKVVFSSSIMYNNYVTIAQRRRRAEVEREHQERIQAVDELSKAVGRKDEFIAVVGHELRTPLNAIIQLAGALARGAGGQMQERGKAWLETISSSAAHLLAIVNDIIIMQAAKSGSIMLRQELVELPKVLDGVLRTLTPLAKRGVVLEKVVHEKLPPLVGDKRRIMQVVSNLVGNALKFTEKGKVSVKAYPDRGARHVLIKIVDTGMGIPKEKLSIIFEAFRQGDMSKTRKHGGVGLGLSIAKELVHAHGGLMSVHSEGAGHGTSVVVKLPVLQQETDQDLEPAFRSAYEALGYHTDELLSPELAKAEGRVCPAFLPLIGSMWNGGAGAMGYLPAMNSQRLPGYPPTGSGYSRRTNGSLDLPLGAEASNMAPSGRVPLMYAPHLAAEGGGSGRPSLSAGMMTPSGRNLMSMDMQHAVVQTYRWSGESANSLPGGFMSGYDRMLQTGLTDAFGSMAPMPPGDGGAGAPGAGEGGEGGREGGAPGFAVALMSSLYAPPDEESAARTNNPAGAASAKGVSLTSVPGALPVGSHEDEREEVAGTGSGFPRRRSGGERISADRSSRGSSSRLPALDERTVMTEAGLAALHAPRERRKSGLSIASSAMTFNMHPVYTDAVDRASQVVHAAMEAAEVVRASQAANAVAAANGSSGGGPQPARDSASQQHVGEWDSFVKQGGGIADRGLAPAVVANNARLSAQYEEALAEAEAKKLPLDPQWHSWVARIPDHHRQGA